MRSIDQSTKPVPFAVVVLCCAVLWRVLFVFLASLTTKESRSPLPGLVHELPPLGTTWVWCGKESRSRIADKAWSAAGGWRECRRYRVRAKGRMPSTPLVYGGPCFFRFAGFLCCWALPIRILSCLRFAVAWGASPRRFRWARNLCQEPTQ